MRLNFSKRFYISTAIALLAGAGIAARLVYVQGGGRAQLRTLLEQCNKNLRAADYPAAQSCFKTGAEKAHALRFKEIELYFLYGFGVALENNGEHAYAYAIHKQTLETSITLRETKLRRDILRYLAKEAQFLEQYDAAADYCDKALDLYDPRTDKDAMSTLLNQWESISDKLGDLSKAADIYKKITQLARLLGDSARENSALGKLSQTIPKLAQPAALPPAAATSQLPFGNIGYGALGSSTTTVSTAANGWFNDIRSDLFMAEVAFKLSNFKKAAQSLEKPLQIAHLHGNRKLELIILQSLFISHRRYYAYSEALQDKKRSIELNEKNGDAKDLVKEYLALGTVYSDLKDYQSASDSYTKALNLAEKNRDAEGKVLTLYNLSILSLETENYETAMDYVQRGLATPYGQHDKVMRSGFLSELGWIYFNTGDYSKALALVDECDKLKNTLGENHMGAASLRQRGMIAEVIGDYPLAKQYYMESLKISDGEKNNRDIIKARLRLGDYYSRLSSLDRMTFITKDNNRWVVDNESATEQEARMTYISVILLSKQEGLSLETPECAMAELDLRAGKIEEALQVFTRYHSAIGQAECYLAQKQYSKALAVLSAELQRIGTNSISRTLAGIYTGMGLAEENIGDIVTAKEYFSRAVDKIEQTRSALPQSLRTNYLTAQQLNFPRIAPYEGLIRTSHAEDAFYYSEFTRGRFFAESLPRRAAHSAISTALAAKEVDLQNRMATAAKQRDQALENKNFSLQKELTAKLAQLGKEQDSLISNLRRQYPAYAATRYPQPVHAAEVALKPDEILLEFSVTDTKTVLFILNGATKKLSTRSLPLARGALANLVAAYRGSFEQTDNASSLANFDAASGKKLYDTLFGDTLANISPAATLVIVPGDMLGNLPFEALPVALPAVEKMGDGNHGPFPLGITYLGDKFPVLYSQSATALTLLRTMSSPRSTGQNALALVDPVFSCADSRAAALTGKDKNACKTAFTTAVANWKKMGVGGAKRRGDDISYSGQDAIFPRLEKTAALGVKMTELFPGAKILSGSDATRDKLLSLPLEKYRYIAFATHGILDGTLPYIRQPALVLNQVGNHNTEDGFLTMDTLLGLNLTAEAVALTACDTGRGNTLAGEGIMGMGSAFEYAGAQNVLMSLWSVSEDASVALTAEFFTQLKQGKPPEQALKLASSAIRHQGYENPFYWSAFILLGH